MAGELVPVKSKKQLTHLLDGLDHHGISGVQGSKVPAEQLTARSRAPELPSVVTLLSVIAHASVPLLEPEEDEGKAWFDLKRESKLDPVFQRPLHEAIAGAAEVQKQLSQGLWWRK